MTDETRDRLLGKMPTGEWVKYRPPLRPGWYDVEVVEGEDVPLTGTLTVELRDTGWTGLSPHARIQRVRRRTGPPN